MNNSLQGKKQETLPLEKKNRLMVKKYASEISKALPGQIGKNRFNRVCLSIFNGDPKLASCTTESLIGALLNTAQLGLEPNTPLGYAYIIPYNNWNPSTRTKRMEAQYQIGYKGMIELARRSGEISMIRAESVYSNDEFEYCLGLNPDIKHIPAKGKRGEVIAYYAFYRTRSGDVDFAVATKQEMEDFRKKFSKSNKGPWVDNFDEMAKKTLVKRVLKYAPLSAELMSAIQTDSTIKSVEGNVEVGTIDMTLIPDSTVYEEEPAAIEHQETEIPVVPETGEVIEPEPVPVPAQAEEEEFNPYA